MGISQWREDFEAPSRDWFVTGGAGFDHGLGLARTGQGNGWVRQSQGWNALNKFHDVLPFTTYRVGAWLRLSPGLTDGYLSVREARELNGEGRIISEIKLVGGRTQDYEQYWFDFDTGDVSRILLYVGLWGVGRDDWIQVDDVALQHSTPY